MTTIRCRFCGSVITDPDVLEALRLSDEHLTRMHPGATSQAVADV
jgi:hypothetical protein